MNGDYVLQVLLGGWLVFRTPFAKRRLRVTSVGATSYDPVTGHVEVRTVWGEIFLFRSEEVLVAIERMQTATYIEEIEISGEAQR